MSNIHKCIFNNIFFADFGQCDADNGGCEHICSDFNGTSQCSCNTGFKLNNDMKSCIGNARKYCIYDTVSCSLTYDNGK